MKKSNFTALMLGTISGVMFALGMCMTLLPEWNSFKPGIIFGSIGIILGIITVFVWRRMENKPPVKISGKGLWIILIAIIGALILGVGMCFCMVWGNIILGTIIGLFGIITLLMLISLTKGIK